MGKKNKEPNDLNSQLKQYVCSKIILISHGHKYEMAGNLRAVLLVTE